MKKYRVKFEIDEEVEAENSEDAVSKAIEEAIGGCYYLENELTRYIQQNAYIEILEDKENK